MNERGRDGAEPEPVQGIHHVTAICGDPQENVDFYSGVLGLRFVKKTVNFDDPGTYHLYYGNTVGEPGTIMTFFPWPGRRRGRAGQGQVTVTALRVPAASLPYWVERLEAQGVAFDGPRQRFDEQVLVLQDPDGLRLELVAAPGDALLEPWTGSEVPAEHAIRGFYGISMSVSRPDASGHVLTALGFRRQDEESGGGDRQRLRYVAGDGQAPARVADLLIDASIPAGRVAVGSVHHVAWRAADETEQQLWQRQLSRDGLNVTPVINRFYFRSIYFHEPSGILFEIATDPPGFTVDEDAETLGKRLQLPPELEPRRQQIEARLPSLTGGTSAANDRSS